MADKTTDPESADINIANTTDFIKAFTDYNTHISKFTKEMGISNVNRYIDVTVDPIIDKAQLFTDLTKGDLAIKTDPRGGKDKKGKLSSPINKKSVGFESDPSRDVDGLEDEFLAYWVEKYRVLHPVIQQECEKLLPGKSNIYFKDISESIGCLTETDFIDDDRVLPSWDVDVDKYDPPMVYNSKLHNKLSINTQLINLKMSKLLNVTTRNNLANIINGPNSHKLEKDSSTESHGNNLITDFAHRTRMNKIVTELVSTLQKQYEDLWRLVEWFNSKENKSTYPFKKISLEVEGTKISVDILKNKLYKTKKEHTNNCMLSVDCEDKFTRNKRLAKEKLEDEAVKAKRNASFLEKVKSLLKI